MKWTKEFIIETIRSKSAAGVCSSSSVGMTCSTMARRKFGSFAAACEASGVIASGSVPHTTTCKAKGCSDKPRSSRADYCEKHYMRFRRNGSTNRQDGSDVTIVHNQCYYCGTPTNGLKFCSSRCSARSNRGNPLERECVACGSKYEPTNKGIDRTYCSDKCKEALRRSQQFNYSGLDRSNNKGTKLNIFKWLLSDTLACGICGEQIDMKAPWPEPLSFTVDHIVPLSKGGSHTECNIQPAHASCNSRKHAT